MIAKVDKNTLEKIWASVPVDYYQSSVKSNLLQYLWHTRKLHQVLSLITISPSTTLDVGCASGWFLSELKKRHPTTKAIGVDVYKKAILYGQKLYPDLKLMQVDVHKLPFKTKSFDVIVCAEVLEHVVDPVKVLQEIKRVAKPSSEILIEMDSGSKLFSLIWSLWTTLKGKV